jgi:hypothetical protein
MTLRLWLVQRNHGCACSLKAPGPRPLSPNGPNGPAFQLLHFRTIPQLRVNSAAGWVRFHLPKAVIKHAGTAAIIANPTGAQRCTA